MSVATKSAMITGVCGVLLFVFMFLAWYEPATDAAAEEIAERARQAAEQLGVDAAPAPDAEPTRNAWESFAVTDWVLLLAVIVSVGVAAVVLSGVSVSLPIAGAALTTGAGLLALLLVLYRVIDPPGDGELDREVGLWLGLLASVGIVLGGYLGMQEES
ncbi:MAG: hypothetical protein M3M99_02045 [Actinomycetota bacterium]|nr:hypothetical protein [Actinomycetota bacterium]